MMKFGNLTLWACAFAVLTACGGGEKENKTADSPEKKNQTEEKTDEKSETVSKSEDLKEVALKTTHDYFGNLSKGAYSKASQSFSKKVVQWITIKNTSPEVIAKEAKRFLSSKKGVQYTIDDESFKMLGNTANVKVRQQWAGYDATVEVELSFDKNAKIFSYLEHKAVFKSKNTPVATLEAFLKKLPKKNLPISFSTGEEFTNMSDLAMKVLMSSPDDINFMKEGIRDGMMRAYECFWYPISEDVVGIVTANGGRIITFSLSTFNRKTGDKIDEEMIGNAGAMMQMNEVAQVSMKKDLTIQTDSEVMSPEYSADDDPKPKVEKHTYQYTVTKSGGIKKF